jgi:hypothetical protein
LPLLSGVDPVVDMRKIKIHASPYHPGFCALPVNLNSNQATNFTFDTHILPGLN